MDALLHACSTLPPSRLKCRYCSGEGSQIPSETHHGSSTLVTSQRSASRTGDTRSHSDRGGGGTLVRGQDLRDDQVGLFDSHRNEQVNGYEKDQPWFIPHRRQEPVFFVACEPLLL